MRIIQIQIEIGIAIGIGIDNKKFTIGHGVEPFDFDFDSDPDLAALENRALNIALEKQIFNGEFSMINDQVAASRRTPETLASDLLPHLDIGYWVLDIGY